MRLRYRIKNCMLALFINASLLLNGSVSASQATYEGLPVLDAADLLGKESLQGPHYRIKLKVINDGRMNHYQLSSEVQDIHAYGDFMAVERAYEIEAIVALRNSKQLDAYIKGLKNAAGAPFALTHNIFEQPGSTLHGMAGALRDYQNDIEAVIGSLGKSASEHKERYATIKGLIGFYQVKNALAGELGVDPFSSNLLLQKELNEVAWVMFAGGEVIDVALHFAPIAGSFAISLADIMDQRQADWDVPPPTLRQAALKAVLDMGMHKEAAEAVVFHETCSLRHQMVMISALADLGDVRGRERYLQLATTANSESECRHYQQFAELIRAGHHAFPVREFHLSEGQIWLEGVGGTRILPLRADYLIWSETTDKQFAGFPRDSRAWVSGRVSEKTQNMLRSRGILVRQQLLLDRPDSVGVASVLLPERDKQLSKGEWEAEWLNSLMGHLSAGVGKGIDSAKGLAGEVKSSVEENFQRSRNVTDDVASGLDKGVEKSKKTALGVARAIGISVGGLLEELDSESLQSGDETVDRPSLLSK